MGSRTRRKRQLCVKWRLFAERLEDRRLLAVLFSHDEDDSVRAIAPSEAAYNNFGLDWIGGSEPFNDSAWMLTKGSPNGVGYDRGGMYDPLLGADLEASMYAARTTMFVRAEFDVGDPAAVDKLTLNLRYDDGFIAWLNGVEIARANAATVYPAWDAAATGTHQASTSAFDTFDLADAIASLRAGTNVLAIRELNASAADDDALIQFTLTGESRTGPPLAVDDSATTDEGVPVTIDVLANDQEGSDAINPASVTIASPPAYGTVVANSDGTIIYTPNPVYNGPDTFTYTVRDGTGVGQPTVQTLVSATAPARALVPTNNSLGTTWQGGSEPFNDSSWQAGTLGVGYERSSGYESYLGIDVGPTIYNINTSVYIRSTFTLASPTDVTALTLRMRYDDGFAAFINGIPVASANAPGGLSFNSTATSDNPDSQATQFQTFDITSFANALRPGPNVLALHGLNSSPNSSDMLIQPELVATIQPRGQVSNAATVTVNVTGIDYPPNARDDAYATEEGETLEVSASTGGGGSTNVSIIDSGANWRYRDTGQLPANDPQGRTWKQQGYDDAAWASGLAQLGYGDGDGDEATVISYGPDGNNKYVTSWFRRSFTLDATAATGATSLLVELQRDDGGAVYINGIEVVRDGLPGVLGDDTLTADTFAATTVDETTFFPFTIDLSLPRYANLLRAGDNVVAVEIHQTDRVSSDVSFDLRLSATIELVAGVLGNDTDPDGQTMTAVLETPPTNGTLDLDPDGTFTYTPNAGFVGVDTFAYRASDGLLISDPATVTISVNHLPPMAVGESYATDEDVTLVVDAATGVLANDSDTQGHALSAVLVSPPTSGTLTLAADGSFTYAPAANFHGVDRFTYRASDGAVQSDVAIVTIAVNAVDDPPAAADDMYDGVEGVPLVVDGRVNSQTTTETFAGLRELPSYLAGGSVSQLEFSSPFNLLFLRSGGSTVRVVDVGSMAEISQISAIETFTDFDLTPDGTVLYVADYGGTNIGYGTPRDPSYVHRFDLATRTWQTKQAPEIAYHVEAVDGERFLLCEQDQSVDLTLNRFGSLPNAPIVQLSHTTRRAGDFEYDAVNSRIFHGNSGSSSQEITVTTLVGDSFTMSNSTGTYGTAQGYGGSDVVSLDGRFFFYGRLQVDAANIRTNLHTYPAAIHAATGNLAFDAEGRIFNALSGEQVAALPFTTSVYGASDEQLHVWAYESSGGRVRHYVLPRYGDGVLVNDEQPEHAIMSAQLIDGPTNGALDLAADGTFRYTPNPGFFGVDSFTYVATSTEGTSVPATVTLNIAHGGPALVADAYQIDEDGVLDVEADAGVLANDSDSQGHAIAAALETSPQSGTLTFNLDGSFRYTPDANFHGVDTFAYRASDGQITSDPATVTITVNSINDVPIAADDTFTIDRGTSLELSAPSPIAETIAATSFALPSTGAVDYVAAGGELGFSAASTPGNTELGVTAEDWYIVRGVSSAFTLSFDPVSLDGFQNVQARIDLRSYEDSAGFEPEDFFRAYLGLSRVGGPIVLQEIVNVSGTQLKALDNGPSGALTTYSIDIPDGVLTATLTIETSVNSPTERVFFDNVAFTGVRPNAGNVLLENDTDADGDALSVRIVTLPEHGTISTELGGAMIYTPDPLFVGDDTFTYAANDGTVDSSVATVTIHMLLANLIPTAADDAYATNEDVPLVVSAAMGVLANDEDLDGDPLSPAIVDPPQHGTLLIMPDGSFSYMPAENFFGEDTFTYVANDGPDDSNVATVTITISAVNDAPTAVDDGYTTQEGQQLVIGTASQSSDYANLVVRHGATSYWRLGDTSLAVAADARGSANGVYHGNPVLGGQGALLGTSDTAVVFDGVDDYVEAPFHAANNPVGSFSVEAWVQLSGGANTYRAVLASRDDTDPVPFRQRGYIIYADIDNRWAFWTGAGGGSALWHQTLGTAVEFGKWTHIVATFDVTGTSSGVLTGVKRVYIDGALIGSTNSGLYLPNTDEPLRLGAGNSESPTAGVHFPGKIDEVAIYGRALTPAEVQEHFRARSLTFADSITDFSGVQGQSGWYYGYYNRTNDGDGNYQPADFTQFPFNTGPWSATNFWDAGSNRWKWFQGNPPWTEILADNVHPGGQNNGQEHWAIRRWVSDVDGPTTIVGNLSKLNTGGGDGVRGIIYVDGVAVFNQTIAGTDGQGVDFSVDVDLAEGAIVDFVVTPNSQDGQDGTYFNAKIISATAAPSTVGLVSRGDTWRYRDNITNGSPYPVDAQSDLWNEGDYDDSAWPSGPAMLGYGEIVAGQINTTIGYGGNASDKYRTALFRRTFEVESAERVVTLPVEALFDDGAAIYINGREVLRHNLPGTLGDNTLRTDTFTTSVGPEDQYQQFTIDLAAFPDLLVDGTNTIAVEVHQTDPFSSDLGFDLSLTATVLPDPQAAGVLGNDTDIEDDDLTAEIVAGPQHGSLAFETDGTFAYTPADGFYGNDSFTYRAFDGAAYSNVATVHIFVTRRLFAVDDAYTIAEDSPLSVPRLLGVLANDPDAADSTVTPILDAGPTHGTLTLAPNGAFLYRPNANFAGTDTFTYRTTDGIIASDAATVTITVSAVNDAPTTRDDVYATNVGEALEATGGATTPVFLGPNQVVWPLSEGGNGHVYEIVNQSGTWLQARAFAESRSISDVQGHLATITSASELAFVASKLPAGGWFGGYQDPLAPDYSEPAGGWRWVTGEPWQFTNWFPGEPNDGVGGQSFYLEMFGEHRWNDATGAVVLNMVWIEYPTSIFESPTSELVARGATWRYRDGIVNGSPYPTDAQGDRWNEPEFDDSTWPSGPAILGYGGIEAGTTRTTLLMNPPGGGQTSITALFRREIEVVDAQRITALSLDGLFDDGASIYINGQEVLRHNLPGAVGDGTLATDTLTSTTGNESSYQQFTIDLAAFPGLFVEGTNVVAAEVHQVGITSSDIGFDLAISATYAPDPAAAGVLGNDTDAEGDDITAVLVAGPYHGTLALRSDGTFIYTPNAGFEGVDQFTYRASDGTAESAETLVTINVGDANEAPLAAPDRYVARSSGALTVAAAVGVLANDFDANGDALAALVFTPPQRGVLSLAADGGFSYTPQTAFVGVDTFTYRVSDGDGTVGFATATIHVLAQVDPINGIPLAGDDVFGATAGALLTVAAPGVLANDSDPEQRSIFAVVERSPWHGLLSFAADGSFTYTPRLGFGGADSFTYRTSDGNTFSAPATATIDVAAAAPPGAIVVSVPPGHSVPGGGTANNTLGLTGTTTSPPTLPVFGDVNGDGRVDRADLAAVVAAYGSITDSVGFAAADVNGDGRVSLADAIAVRNSMGSAGGISYAAGSLVRTAAARLGERDVDRVLTAAKRVRNDTARRPLAASAVDSALGKELRATIRSRSVRTLVASKTFITRFEE